MSEKNTIKHFRADKTLETTLQTMVKTEPGAPASAVLARWDAVPVTILRNTMKSRKVTYKSLARALEGIGIVETADNLNRKIARGRFSAAFFLMCMSALEVAQVSVPIQPKKPLDAVNR